MSHEHRTNSWKQQTAEFLEIGRSEDPGLDEKSLIPNLASLKAGFTSPPDPVNISSHIIFLKVCIAQLAGALPIESE